MKQLFLMFVLTLTLTQSEKVVDAVGIPVTSSEAPYR